MENDSSRIARRTFLLGGLAGVSSLFLPFRSAEALPNFEPFSFVFVTDSHLVSGVPDTGVKMLQESQLYLQESIKFINKLKPQFVVFGGDQVEEIGKNEVNWLLFGDICQALEAPWSFVLGEHDVSGKTAVDKMRTFGGDWKSRGIISGQSYWSLDPIPGVHIVGLDTSVPNSETGYIHRSQLEWLKQDLQSNRGKITIVFSHHPVLPPPPFDGPPWEEYSLPTGSDVREIIGGFPDVKMVVSGHVYVNKVQVEREIYHVSCSAMNVYPCQFKQFRVSREGILMESHDVPFPALVKKGQKMMLTSSLASKFNSRNPEAYVDLCVGEKQDQNALLSFSGRGIQPLSKKDLEKQRQVKEDPKANKKGKDKKGKNKKSGEEKEEKGGRDKRDKSGEDRSGQSSPEKPKPEESSSTTDKSTDKSTDRSTEKAATDTPEKPAQVQTDQQTKTEPAAPAK